MKCPDKKIKDLLSLVRRVDFTHQEPKDLGRGEPIIDDITCRLMDLLREHGEDN